MIDTVRNFAIDWQDWASTQKLTYGELAGWQETIKNLAVLADPDGSADLVEELKENGVI